MKLVTIALCLVLLSVPVLADSHFPLSDLTLRNSDGEIITLWSPHSFYFDGSGFEKPVQYRNGTALIGSIA
jgi:hypothetical protein